MSDCELHKYYNKKKTPVNTTCTTYTTSTTDYVPA